ncbi:MAG: PocR ligand-binding domain-containing protein [Candidatus Omnitrophica bacterium]|nr:PocR ligand-binding domain-containing protein [Candidatus Omnitrophota bacterium]
METGFLELIDEKKWQVIQNYFSEVIRTGVRVIDADGAPLSALSNPHKYCFENISSSPKAYFKCKDCLVFSPKPMSGDNLLNNPQFFIDLESQIYYDSCDFHANRVVIPVESAKAFVRAYIVIGPVLLGKRKTYPEYFNMCKLLGLDISSVIESVEQIRVFSFSSIRSIVKLFKEIADFMIETGVEKMERNAQKKNSLELMKTEVPFYIDKMLQALLETAGEGVKAERGSIMVVDDEAKTLSIKLSKGIPEDVAAKTEVKLGEGLAGWAAREDKILFIDKSFKNPRLLSRLHKPGLSASLMVPIKTGESVFGVLNLSTENPRHKFNKENINSIIQLTKMVDSALCGIKDKAAKSETHEKPC